jgi:hypothetical protein
MHLARGWRRIDVGFVGTCRAPYTSVAVLVLAHTATVTLGGAIATRQLRHRTLRLGPVPHCKSRVGEY